MLYKFVKRKINLHKNFNNILTNYFKNDDNITKLHRWCNNTSDVYKNTCDWEKKLDIAQLDNCYSGIYNQKTNKY